MSYCSNVQGKKGKSALLLVGGGRWRILRGCLFVAPNEFLYTMRPRRLARYASRLCSLMNRILRIEDRRANVERDSIGSEQRMSNTADRQITNPASGRAKTSRIGTNLFCTFATLPLQNIVKRTC